MTEFYYRDLSKVILDAAYKVHTALGPGLMEKAYEICLEHELLKAGCTVHRQVGLSIVYDDIEITNAYFVDLWVNEKIILELKSVAALEKVHYKQLLTYMRLSNSRVGYLINFNSASLKDGISRMVL